MVTTSPLCCKKNEQFVEEIVCDDFAQIFSLDKFESKYILETSACASCLDQQWLSRCLRLNGRIEINSGLVTFFVIAKNSCGLKQC